MEDPNADTEWNDVLRAKGILPPRKETEKTLTEDDVVQMMEETIGKKAAGKGVVKTYDELDLDELDELEDEEDDRVLEEYRRKRMQEMKVAATRAKYGAVKDITAVDYVDEVNKAGDDIWVVLHLYKEGIPLCSLINQFLQRLAAKFPATKFLRAISTTCIPNFPDANLPTVFVYKGGEMKRQMVGAPSFGGMSLKCDELEWRLGEAGAVETTLEKNPRPAVDDVMASSLRNLNRGDSDDDNDW